MNRPTLTTMISVGIVSLARSTAGLFQRKRHTGMAKSSANIALTAEEKERGIKLTDKGIKFLVDPKELVKGVPARDAIPSIDNPKFVSVKEANKWPRDTDLVLGIDYNGAQRAYPLRIMAWHEIVNDEIAGDPILITYCPLCASGIAYERKIDSEEVQFGTSGKLYNSNLVMYDRKTETLWSQFDGLAIIGELVGKELTLAPEPLVTTYWKDWRKSHPETEVLSKDTGFRIKRYGSDPYAGYYSNKIVLFNGAKEHGGIHPKKVVFGVQIRGAFKAYVEDDLIKQGTINDTLGGAKIKVVRDNSGTVTVVNEETGENIISERSFWFAWRGFHPDTEVYNKH